MKKFKFAGAAAIVACLISAGVSAPPAAESHEAQRVRSLPADPSADPEPVLIDGLTTARSVTYLEPDGSLRADVYATAVNYRESGDWVPIEPTLEEVAGDGVFAESDGTPFDVTLYSAGSTAGVEMDLRGQSIELTSDDLVEPELTSESSVVYQSDSGSVSYELNTTGVKETIVLDAPPFSDEAARFQFELALDGGLTPELVDGRVVEFRDQATGRVVAHIPPGFMFDASDPVAESTDVTYDLQDTGDRWSLTVVPSTQWLNDPERVYPVSIDPTLSAGPINDCWISSNVPNETQCGGSYFRVGTHSGDLRRGLLRFNLDAIPNTATVNSAALNLYLEEGYSNSSLPANYSVRQAGKLFNSAATWNSPGTGGTWNGGSPGTTNFATRSLDGTIGGYKAFTGTMQALVQGWVSAPDPVEAVVLMQTGGAVENVLRFSSSSGVAAQMPYLSINYSWVDNPDDAFAEPGEPAQTSYGVDEYLLSDIEGMAELDGVSLQVALDRYAWSDQFSDALASIADAHPTKFAWAQTNATGVDAAIHFTGTVPTGLEPHLAALPEGLEVTLSGGSRYNETQRAEVVANAVESVRSQVISGTTVLGHYDLETETVEIQISRQVETVGGPEAPSEERLAADAEVAATANLGNAPEATVTVVETAEVAAGDETVRGGVKIGWYNNWDCTSGFPVKVNSQNEWGILTARHCANDYHWYAAETSTQRAVLSDASRWLSTRHGDIQYHKSSETVGRSFYTRVGGYRSLKGAKKPYLGMPACLFGRTTEGYKNGSRTCSFVQDLTEARNDYGGLVEVLTYVSSNGDSGGPWYWGRRAVGIHSGWEKSCVMLICRKTSQFTPVWGNVPRMNLVLWTTD